MPQQPGRPCIVTRYKKDGTLVREVVGVKGEGCLAAVKPYNSHLPAGYQMTPTAEFYESPVAEPEHEKETE